ncbi:hypothetical protein [Paraburkholderia tropica]|uniref:hypothetical protein n=1 Tax=Paraburkholderia tropica TaxID=92647 RepID=UPI002ABD3E05|nr:hypothetical protein [Paraburkholderia tropica]
MLLKSLFDPEPAAVPVAPATPVTTPTHATPATAVMSPEAGTASAPAAADGTLPRNEAHDKPNDDSNDTAGTPLHATDPLLDGIDALGEIVLTLDAQLRAQNASHTALCQRLHGELGALRRALR